MVWDKFNLSSNYGWLWHTSDILKAKSEWENYKNSLLLTNEEGLNKIPTRIYTIVNVNTWEKDKK